MRGRSVARGELECWTPVLQIKERPRSRKTEENLVLSQPVQNSGSVHELHLFEIERFQEYISRVPILFVY